MSSGRGQYANELRGFLVNVFLSRNVSGDDNTKTSLFHYHLEAWTRKI